MADDTNVDLANEQAEQFLTASLRQHQERTKTPAVPSAHRCEDCDDTIPEARRQAVPGCYLCVSCAEERER